MQIEEKVVAEEQHALINYIGPVEDMIDLINEIAAWIEDNKIQVAGSPFAIYYASPKNDAEKVTYDIGFPVLGEIQGTSRIVIATIPEHTVISAKYKGPYSDLPDVYKAMVEFVMINKYDVIGSPKEVYYNSPEDVSVNELVTEVQFPVIKMG